MDVQQGRSKVVTLVPDSPMVSPTAAIYDRLGADSGVTVTATASAVDTVVVTNTANTRQAFELDDITDVAPGLHVLVADSQFGTAVGVVSAVDADTYVVRLVDPLPAVPSADATVKGLDVTVTIPTDATGALYLGYILEVSASGVDPIRVEFNVVRFPFVGPCKAHHVRAVLARGYPGELSRDEQFHALVAAEVNAQIRSRLLASARYVSAYWNPDTLGPVRSPMLRLVLAEQHGLRESGADREQYLSAMRLEVTARLGDVLNSLQPADGNMDGKIDDYEAKGDIGAEWVR